MTLDKAALSIPDNDLYTYTFFNDTATTEIYTRQQSSAASDVYKRQVMRHRAESSDPLAALAGAISRQTNEV